VTDESAPISPVSGWFGEDDEGAFLVGRRCLACGSWSFPPMLPFCRNPRCGGDRVEDAPMSRRGSLWSFTYNHYPPPSPYPGSGDSFEPYGVAAVELANEAMIVLGQVARGVEPGSLQVGMEMALVIEPLPDGQPVWKWRPVA
jgi:uncharacterized OB-fold protein